MIRYFLLLVGGTVLGAALVTPPLYVFLGYLWEELPWPFSRVYDRVAMVIALILILALRRATPLGEVQEALRSSGATLRKGVVLVIGIAIALLPATGALLWLVDGDPLIWKTADWGYYVGKLLKVIPAALLISVIEEVFFRGIVFRRLLKSMSVVGAVVLTSLFYSSVHFIQPVKSFQPASANPFEGIWYLGAVFSRYTEPGILSAGFGLFLVGIVLALTAWKTRSLWLGIGLHMGWVIIMKASVYSTTSLEGAIFPSGSGRRYYLLTQPLVWGVIGVSGLITYLVLKSPVFRKAS